MSNVLVAIESSGRGRGYVPAQSKILLVKPPYFTPWTPPLGIAILKSYLEQNDYSVRDFDYNTDAELWGMHHKYFAAIQTLESVSINDGYSKLWWILHAHMLSYANDADAETCARVLEQIIPLYGIHYDREVIATLVELVDNFFKRLAAETDRINLSDFAVVGTSTYTTSLATSLFILKRIKQRYPHVITVMGGGVFADDLALGSDNLQTLVEEYPFVDHAILGEGELLFLKLLQGELANKRVISIADLKGETLAMSDVPAPDFSDLDTSNYYHLTIEGARSCPFQCSFCSETIQWGDYRKKPMDMFVNQVIELAQKYGNNSFFMGDSLMNPYIAQFSRALLDLKADVLYDGYLRADKPVTHLDKVMQWSHSGLYRVRLGIESASARVLDSMDKMTTPKVISDVLKTLASAGIRTTTYWIVGFPGETDEDFRETCEFVKEHHPFIYELEAHPYYYYPYGQIGSRLHQCRSLYPDDVTRVTKFKVWDIIDANPSREVRYERLRELSALASSCGLPNIYRMSDRYKAEERWQLLHPLVKEVYEGTRLHREETKLPGAPIRNLAAGDTSSTAGGAEPLARAHSYHLSAAKALDPVTVRRALGALIEANEMLQLRQEGDQLAADPFNPQTDAHLLSIYDKASEEEGGLEATLRRAAAELAEGLQPRTGESLRCALVQDGAESSHLLLLIHRAIADTRSLTLFAEDLFRLYEQLSEGMEISLRPVRKTYAGLLEELDGAGSPAGSESGGQSAAAVGDAGSLVPAEVEVLKLDKDLAERLSSAVVEEYGLTPAEYLALAVQRVAGRREGGTGLSVRMDYRGAEPGLASLVGPLTYTHRLSAVTPDGANIPRALKEAAHDLRQTLRDGERTGTTGAAAVEGIFINLEFFTQPAWLGGNQWRPHGFIYGEPALAQGHALSLTPLPTADGALELRVGYRPLEGAAESARAFAAAVAAEVETCLGQCERYAEARGYWRRELAGTLPTSSLKMYGAVRLDAGRRFAALNGEFNAGSLEKLRALYGADAEHILLATFTVLLSRLGGQEEVIVVASEGDGEAASSFPLRLYPSWGKSFGRFLEEVQRALAGGIAHGIYAPEVIGGEIQDLTEQSLVYALDAGYAFDGGSEVVEAAPGTTPHEHERELLESSSLTRKLDLVLSATAGGAGGRLRFVYNSASIDRDIVEQLAGYMSVLLDALAEGPQTPLGELPLEKTSAGAVGTQALSGEFLF